MKRIGFQDFLTWVRLACSKYSPISPFTIRIIFWKFLNCFSFSIFRCLDLYTEKKLLNYKLPIKRVPKHLQCLFTHGIKSPMIYLFNIPRRDFNHKILYFHYVEQKWLIIISKFLHDLQGNTYGFLCTSKFLSYLSNFRI